MAFYSACIAFDRTFAKPNGWIWLDEIRTVRCRLRIGAEEYSPVDIHVHFRGARRHGMHKIAPLADGTFVVGPSTFDHEGLPRVELRLIGAPEEVAQALLRI